MSNQHRKVDCACWKVVLMRQVFKFDFGNFFTLFIFQPPQIHLAVCLRPVAKTLAVTVAKINGLPSSCMRCKYCILQIGNIFKILGFVLVVVFFLGGGGCPHMEPEMKICLSVEQIMYFVG